MAIHNKIVSLEEILKKKGIGPEGSKSLNKEELDFVDVHYQNSVAGEEELSNAAHTHA